MKTLKLCSCEIPDVACTALVHFLQSPHCVLETFELSDPHRLQYGIPVKLLKEIGSNRTLKSCVLDCFRGSIVQHFVTGIKKNESPSHLEKLTVLCSGCCPEYDYEYYNELIRVANKHTAITKLKLNHDFKEFVRKHNIRDSLTIDTDCTCTYLR